MRFLARQPLPTEAQNYLERKQADVNRSSTPEEEASRIWPDALGTKKFDDIKAALVSMNDGQTRCMYCEYSEAGHIDHFRPKTRFPEHAFQWSNFFLSCERCNSGSKGTQFPMANGSPLLLKPDQDQPRNHLELSKTTGRFQAAPSSPKATPTINTFDLNRQILTQGRSDAWKALERLLCAFGEEKDSARCHELLIELKRHCFRSVFEEIVLLFRCGHHAALKSSTVDVLSAHPEVHDWLNFTAAAEPFPVGPPGTSS